MGQHFVSVSTGGEANRSNFQYAGRKARAEKSGVRREGMEGVYGWAENPGLTLKMVAKGKWLGFLERKI